MSKLAISPPCNYASTFNTHWTATILLKKLGENTVKVHFDAFIELAEKHLIDKAKGATNSELNIQLIHEYSSDSRKWIRFQYFRKLFGLVCFAEYHTQPDLMTILRSFAYQKDQYVGQGLLSVLILIDCCNVQERALIQQQHPYGLESQSVIVVTDLGKEVSLSAFLSHPTLVSTLRNRMQSIRESVLNHLLEDRKQLSPLVDSLSCSNSKDLKRMLDEEMKSLEGEKVSMDVKLDKCGIYLTPSIEKVTDFHVEMWDKSRSMRRRYIARVWKHLGDVNLLLGAVAEAKICYQMAHSAFKALNDLLWLAGTIEAQCSIGYLELQRSGASVSQSDESSTLSQGHTFRRSSSAGELESVLKVPFPVHLDSSAVSSSSSVSVDTGLSDTSAGQLESSLSPTSVKEASEGEVFGRNVHPHELDVSASDSALEVSSTLPSVDVDKVDDSTTIRYTPQTLLDRLRDVISSYKKQCNQPGLSLEVAAKAFHFALENQMRSDALMLLQLEMLHMLPLVEHDMITLHFYTSQWYFTLGHRRKACFSLWRASQAAQQFRNALGQPRPRFHRMYQHLLLVCAELRMSLPKLELTTVALLHLRPVAPVWPSLQVVVFKLLLFVLDKQMAMKDPQLSMTTLKERLIWEWTEIIIYHLHLLDNWALHLKSEDILASFERIKRGFQNLQEFFSSPRGSPHQVLTTEWNQSLPLSLLQRPCVVVQHLPTIVDAIPMPVKGYLKPIPRVASSLFAFQPEAHKLKQRKRVTEVVWVMHEKANLLFTLCNPLAVELKMTNVVLLLEVNPPSGAASVECTYPIGDCILPPRCPKFEYRFSIYPQMCGNSRIVGLTYYLPDCDHSLWLRNHYITPSTTELVVHPSMSLCQVSLNLETLLHDSSEQNSLTDDKRNIPDLMHLGLQDMRDVIVEQYHWHFFPGEVTEEVKLQIGNKSSKMHSCKKIQARISCIHAEPTLPSQLVIASPRERDSNNAINHSVTSGAESEEEDAAVDLIHLRTLANGVITFTENSLQKIPTILSQGSQVELSLAVNHTLASHLQYALSESCDLYIGYLLQVEYESLNQFSEDCQENKSTGVSFDRRHFLLLHLHVDLGLQCFYWQPLTLRGESSDEASRALFHFSNLCTPHYCSGDQTDSEMNDPMGSFCITGPSVGEMYLLPHCSTSIKLSLLKHGNIIWHQMTSLDSITTPHRGKETNRIRDLICNWMNENVELSWSITEPNEKRKTKTLIRQGRLVFVRAMLPEDVAQEVFLSRFLQLELCMESMDRSSNQENAFLPCDLIPFSYTISLHSEDFQDKSILRDIHLPLYNYSVQVAVCSQDGSELRAGSAYLLSGQTEITQISCLPEEASWFCITFLRSGNYRISMEITCRNNDSWANSNAGVSGTFKRRVFNNSNVIPIHIN